MRSFLYTFGLVLVAGCVNSSGVLRTGPDTFTISTSASPGKGGVPAAKKIAYEEAAAACAQRNLQVLTISETSNSPTWTEGVAKVDLNFKCVPALPG